MSERWTDMERVLRDRAYARLDNDPQSLLETDGGPVGMPAELIYARLYGLEDEIVEDGLRLTRVEPRILMPIRGSLLAADEGPSAELRIAAYELQTGYALLTVAAEYLPPEVPLLPDFTARVLYLRYRRRT